MIVSGSAEAHIICRSTIALTILNPLQDLIPLMVGIWVALLISALPTLLVVCLAERRWDYGIGGVTGGIVGGFCGAASLFLSLKLDCQFHGHDCHDGQAGMGVLTTFPVGALLGCLIGLLSIRLYSSADSSRDRIMAALTQVAFWAVAVLASAWALS
jgi:hypothetical protein